MLQDIQVTRISDLDSTSALSSNSLFIVSNFDTTDWSSYNVKYEDLSAQIYRDIINRTGPEDDDIDPIIAVLSARIDELTTAILRLANCSKQVRTVDLVGINRRLSDLEEFHTT